MARPKKTSLRTNFLSGFLTLLVSQGFLRNIHKPVTNVPNSPPSSHLLAELTNLSQKIAAHALRLKINELVTQTRTLSNYLQTWPSGATPWEDYVRDCLTSTVTGTRRFTALSPHLTDPDNPAVIKFGDFLAVVTQTLTEVYETLANEDHHHSASQIGAYRDTLNGIILNYLGAGKPK